MGEAGGVSEFLYYESKFKTKTKNFFGRGVEGGGGGGGGRVVSEFFSQSRNLKNKK